MNKFDYRKLASYKTAIDDGFGYYYGEKGNPFSVINDIVTEIYRTEEGGYIYAKTNYDTGNVIVYLSSEDFEEYKKKVEEYFTEGG